MSRENNTIGDRENESWLARARKNTERAERRIKMQKRREKSEREHRESSDDEQEKTRQPLQVEADINPEKFIQVPNTKYLISKFEYPGMNNMNYEETHKAVLNQRLFIPTPAIFMPYFKNVIEACKGNRVLKDGNDQTVSYDEIEEIYRHLTEDHIVAYEDPGVELEGAWTWLNGKFVNGDGFNGLDLETIVGIDSNGELETRKEPLEEHVVTDGDKCYTDLDFNSQGLPQSKSPHENYKQGENTRFYFPKQGSVAWFVADSDGAGLNCFWRRIDPDSSLGVFVCCEAAARSK